MEPEDRMIIMRNVRRMITGRIRQPENWILVKEIFGCGSTTAYKICSEMGVDPDSKTTKRIFNYV